MDACAEYLEVAENRVALYGFFARVYRSEVDAELLAALKQIDFRVEEGEARYVEGAARLQAWLSCPSFTMRKDLAVDYAKVFLAAGISQGGAAFPYESVYTSPEGLVMQEARDEVVRLYRTKGLSVGGVVEPEDHVAFELEFMTLLCREGERAARSGDAEGVWASIDEQRAFLANHLMNWVPQFCEDVARYANTDFYRAVASMTEGFIAMDAALLEQMECRRGGASVHVAS
ncbi:TorD/DmsD family molecular chaperone [Gordonibacter sp. An230]|uniref:TorD/DmsD family molecular chaperone n=1 Tax=Gordonibacter sp. An230 TaxID=1965592 RepID=UPI0013A675A2|nr:molecular chaperone TorD family protein [Gordonibacter sp. An230]